MAKQIFVNLAVSDVQKSMDLYTALGFTNNPQFSDDSGKCMVWSDTIFVMLLSHEKFASFATKPIADTKTKLAGLFSLSTESVDEMNNIVTNGLNAGGTEPSEMKDYGFMQQRTIEDFDGHTWEIFFMDMSKLPSEQTVDIISNTTLQKYKLEMWSDRYNYYNIKSDKDFSQKLHKSVVVNYLLETKIFKQINHQTFTNTEQFPWANILLVETYNGNYASSEKENQFVTLIAIVCSKNSFTDQQVYLEVFKQIASKLQWKLFLEEDDEGNQDIEQ